MAMYAESRPYPVDSQMSSAAATRTSTGNMTGNDSLGTAARSPASTSGNDSRGTAYSDSTNLTRRLVTNTRCDASVYDLADKDADVTEFSVGMSRFTRRPTRHIAPNAAFSITSYSQNRRQPGMGRDDT